MQLILYSKPGCHLCEGLQEKLEQIQSLDVELEIRDITTNPEWFQAYQYEIPVLYLVRRQQAAGENQGVKQFEEQAENMHSSVRLPRLSPRATVQQVEKMLQKYGLDNQTE